MKKIRNILLLLITSIFITTFSNVKAEDNNEVIHIANEVIIGNNIEITINLNKIEYSKFKFILESNNTLNNVEISNDINIESNQNEVLFEYNKNTDINSITLKYNLPNTVKVGDIISYNIKIINIENEEDYLTYTKSITITEKKNEEVKPINNKSNTNTNNKQNINNNKSFQVKQTNTNISISTKKVEQIAYKGSDNNYLKSLSVKGYKLNKTFTKDNSTYFITVGKNVKKIKVSATKDDSDSIVKINGNDNLSVGLNKVLITVTAENGATRVYRIYVTKES